jgi:hypothetical protein
MKPKSAKRTAELALKHPIALGSVARFTGFVFNFTLLPSTEVLGYCHLVRCADWSANNVVNG